MKKLVLALMIACSMNVVANEKEVDLLVKKVSIKMDKQIELIQTSLEKEMLEKIEKDIEMKIKVAETEKV